MIRFYVSLAAILCLTMTAMADDSKIAKIIVTSRGVPLPDIDFVFYYIVVKPGEQLDSRRISQDVKNLRDSGRFTYVNANITRAKDGLTLEYVVEIKPRMNGLLVVKGNEAVSASKIREWVALQPGDPVDEAVFAEHGRKVLAEYRRRYYPNCSMKWSTETDAATGSATVTLTVSEGARAKIRRFSFAGNHNIRASELAEPLSDQIYLWYFSWYTGGGRYDPDQLDFNREVLRGIYQNKGYLDVQVSKPSPILYGSSSLNIKYTVSEGPLYRIGDVALGPTTVFAHSNLWPLVRLASNDAAAMNKIELTANAIRDYYQSRGYIRASVRPMIHPRENEQTADIVFDIREGRQVKLGNVEIRGNTRTKDSVIRREILVFPNETFDQTKVRRSERILRNLGFFSSVISYPLETTDPSCDDLVFEVEETRTGQFMIGAGYSSVDEIVGFVEISQGNFDLLSWPFVGAGQKARARVQAGSARMDYELSFVEPWFLGRKLSLGIDLYDHTMSYLSDDYKQRQTGAALTLGKPLPFFFQRAELRYSIDRFKIYGVSTNASDQVQDEAGTRMQSRLGLTFIHDTRNSTLIPTRGMRLTMGAYLAGGPLGMDTDCYGFESRVAQHWTLWWRHVLSLRAWAAVVEEYGSSDDVHLPNRLYLGGGYTMRGFKYRRVGPRDERTHEPLGGKSAIMASAEYTVPIVRMLRVATFYDIGNVWLKAYEFNLDEYCSDAGVGLRIDLPGFPIRLDYAWPLEVTQSVYRTAPRFNFAIGYTY